MVVKNVVGVLLLLLMGGAVLSAQGAATGGPVFEVASVKRNVSGRVGGSFQVPPAGTITFTNITLRVVIRQAYQVDPYTEPYTFIRERLPASSAARVPGRSRTCRASTSRESRRPTPRLPTGAR